ncbi:RING-H2 finger protein ATL3-like [Punica granatum]|nr:RING-H2 finger protein ATL3-like [Punica granatum]OWM66527.1 hypothetical protein CDL15_Pgr013744 [Punica granatum]
MGESSAMGGGPLHDSAPVELTAKILMTAAIVLFLVVIFVLVLHLYAKWFWGRVEESPAADSQQSHNRRRRHHRRRRHFVFAAAAHDPARKGLDPAILRSLPAVICGPDESGEGLECAICLSELVEGEKARLLPKCNHGFHSDCIDMWFESHSTCPICRNPVGGEISKSAETDVEDSSSTSSSNSAGELAEENSSNGQPSESPNFPTNVLFWGNETQVTSRSAACLEEVPSSSASLNSTTATAGTSGSSSNWVDGTLVIDIPRPIESSSSRFAEEEPKSPVTTRLRSLKRLLSRERRVSPCSSSSADAEQV